MANYLPVEKRKQIFHLLCEGNGLRSITRIVGCSKSVVSELQKRYCHIIEYLNKKYINRVNCDEIEADEIRTFVKKKGNIRWIYIALDRKSRMIINFHIGKRDTKDAKIFLTQLSYKLSSEAQVSTDCLTSYVSAVAKTPNGRREAATSSIGLLRAKTEHGILPRSITNRIETHNGNVRQHVSRLTRKTRCFSKKEEGLRQHLTLFFFYYNFIKIHKSLRTTPAVVAGLTDEVGWENKILEYDMLFTETTLMNKDNYREYGRVDLPVKVVSMGEEEIDEFKQGLAGTSLKAKKSAAKVIKLVS